MPQFSPEDIRMVKSQMDRCFSVMTTGLYITPNLGYEIRKGVDDETVRSIYSESVSIANKLGSKYNISSDVLLQEYKPTNHIFFDFVLAFNHLGNAMRIAKIPLSPSA